MGIEDSIETAIYNRLIADTILQGLMGGTVRLYRKTPPDAIMPYLVYRTDTNRLADFSPQYSSTYMIDIWSHSPSGQEEIDIKDQVMSLLHNWASSTSATSEFWLWIQTEGEVANLDEDIWHYACQFNLKYLKDSEVGVLLRR
jgi:hypothetical protein